jgi:hypothetical protein
VHCFSRHNFYGNTKNEHKKQGENQKYLASIDMVVIIVVARFTLIQVDDVILGLVQISFNMSPFLTISSPLVGEALGLITTTTSTLGVHNFKIGFA